MKLTPASSARDQRGRALLFDRPDGAPVARAAAEGHRAQTNFRDELAGAAERTVFHARISLRLEW
jgi:hypothetical protein